MTTQDGRARVQTFAPPYHAAIACVVILAAGCQTMTRSTSPAEPPSTILLDAGDLALPADCTVPAGRPYRVSYVVGTDGRTANPDTLPDAPACLQQALHTWIETFRYAPMTDAERVTADWMLVTARRGS